MDGTDKKRTSLGPVSPSSANKDNKRRATQGSHNRLETPNRTSISGLSYQSPASRLIKKSTSMTTSKIPFHLSASRLSANKPQYTNDVNPTLLDAYNQDRGIKDMRPQYTNGINPTLLDAYNQDRVIKDMRPPNYINCRTQIDHRITETAESAQKNENSLRVIVNIPDIDALDIPRPEWFPTSGILGEQTKRHDSSSSRGKNLMNNFNAAEDDSDEKNKNYDSMVSDDDATEHYDQSHHRGEYLSDDEIDMNLDMSEFWKGYMDLGKPTKICQKCKAQMWNEERNNKSSKNNVPTFSICCKDGQVQLPKERTPPPFLVYLLSGGEKTKHYLKNIRSYNSLFQFTSMGGKIDRKLNNGGGPYCFKFNGQNYHFIGSLKPKEGETPKFCQLYIYDTENEIQNRMNAVPGSDQLDPEIVEGLLKMLDNDNKLAEGFRMARDRFQVQEPDEFSLLLVSSKSASGRPNQIGPSNEVAALIVGDDEDTDPFRDIIVETKQGFLKRVFETCKHFMQLQYPLLFPYGDDGFHLDIPLNSKPRKTATETSNDDFPDEARQRTTVTMREFYAYKLMIRPDQGMTLHLGGRLWQQFVVDAFAAVEQYRLDWIRTHQHVIRSDLYKNVRDFIRKGDTNPQTLGQNVILPATHTGSQRYMNQYFKDSLAICRTIGHPSLFLTMTCNTLWPEIKHMLEYLHGVDVADAPDIIARVFKLKLDQLLDLIKNKNYFGKCIGEIPDEQMDPVGYHVVKKFMIHGPCGNDDIYSPCMAKGKCIRHFPKRFNAHTFFDDCGFPVYRRRRTDATVKKKGVLLDNQYVVPYNRELLVHFHCHINLEVCNSSRSLKYLFKYCLKGHDTATMILRKNKAKESGSTSGNTEKKTDEIQNYLDGRYVCAVEAAWRLFGFNIHYRCPSIERLPVHLEGEKNVSFKKTDNMVDVVKKASAKHSKLEGWFEANKSMPEARQYTYSEFPQFFTWKGDAGKWKMRERGTVFGRVVDVHASAGETFFLRMLLMHQKGATSYKDLRTINGTVYSTFKEACSALGLLKDDNQWHVAMSENAIFSMPRQLRELFVHILSNNQVADPLRLWKQHWVSMSEDVLLSHRRLTNNENLQLSEDEIMNLTLAGHIGGFCSSFCTFFYRAHALANKFS